MPDNDLGARRREYLRARRWKRASASAKDLPAGEGWLHWEEFVETYGFRDNRQWLSQFEFFGLVEKVNIGPFRLHYCRAVDGEMLRAAIVLRLINTRWKKQVRAWIKAKEEMRNGNKSEVEGI